MYGYIDVQSLNSSYNTGTSYSGFYCAPDTVNNDNIGITISYSSFANNMGTESCIYLGKLTAYEAKEPFRISKSNIIRNDCDRTINVQELTIFSNLCILENIVRTSVFSIASDSICPLIDCTVDNLATTGSGSLETSSIGERTFINGLTFISEGDCSNKFDIVEGVQLVLDNLQYQHTDKQALSLSSDAYVAHCYFDSITYSGDGAAIYLSGESVSFLLEFSTFVNCSTIGDTSLGGGLCINYANFQMNHVCALQCQSSYSSFSQVDVSTRTVNSIYLSSIAYCNALNSYTMLHGYGYVDVQSLNLSHNTASSFSGIGCVPDTVKDNSVASISYSSFADNTASQFCIHLQCDSESALTNPLLVKMSNIIRNIGDITVYVIGSATFSSICIMGNTEVTNVFYVESGSKCALVDCSIDNIEKIDTSTVDVSLLGTNSFVYRLSFISTGACINKIDRIDGVPMTGLIERKRPLRFLNEKLYNHYEINH